MILFKDLKIKKELVEKLDKKGIVMPTIVQQKSIPLILKGKDILVQSATGSGKTLGFAVPTIQMIKPERRVQVLVITPTRELARQVAGEYKKFATKGLRTTTVYGGVSIDRQANSVKQADIIVGTPGRLLDLLRRKLLNLTYCKYLILDEADRMLDMGFIDDINKIIKHLPKEKQMMLFSATINSRVLRMGDKYLNNPEKIMLNNKIKKGILKQYYYNVKRYHKLSLLVHLLKKIDRLVLVFCNTKRSTRFVAKTLKLNGLKAEAMNGDMSQYMREKTLKNFALGETNILVATDVASRGIHVEDITHVINFDLPRDVESYTHRIGRTARQGSKGTAIILLSQKDYDVMPKIQKRHRGKIEKKEVPRFERIKIPKKKKRSTRSRRNKRSRRR